MICGCVTTSRSLLPRRSLRQSAKRVPRNSALNHRAHGAVENHHSLPEQRQERIRPRRELLLVHSSHLRFFEGARP